MEKIDIELTEDPFKKLLDEAVALYHAEKFEDATAIYEKILQDDPDNCDALHLLGLVKVSLKNYQGALTLISKAISICPNQASFHSNLGTVLKNLDRNYEAIESLDQAIKLDPNFAQAHMNRGVVLRRLGRYDEALASYTTSIVIDPCDFKAFNNYGNALRDLGQYNQALSMYDYAIGLNPDSPETFMDRGNVLSDLGLISQALASYERSIYLKPDYPEAHLCKALSLLQNERFEEGLELYEWRWRTPQFGGLSRTVDISEANAKPLWLGIQSLSGRTILLQSEQGVGDVIQFCRFAKSVSELGAHVLLEVPKKLIGLLRGFDGNHELIASDSPLPHFDYRCPIMSLPLALKTNFLNIPFSNGYLKADKKRVAEIEQEIRSKNPHSKKLCGISWLSKGEKTGIFRSIHLKDLITMLDKKDLLYVNLQYGDVENEISQVEKDLGVTVLNLDSVNKYEDIEGLAAIIEACDLVISIDNTTVHLAGALGKDTRVLLPFTSEWRWMFNRKDSPWYRSLSLYRQSAVLDWTEALSRLKDDL